MSHKLLPKAMRIDSTPASIKQVRIDLESYAKCVGLDEKSCQDIGLCVNEALANIIRHAYAGANDKPIHLSASPVDGGLRIQIRDWGNGVDPSQIIRDREADPFMCGGLGLICLRSLTDDLQYEPQNPGMLLTFVKRCKHTVPCSLQMK